MGLKQHTTLKNEQTLHQIIDKRDSEKRNAFGGNCTGKLKGTSIGSLGERVVKKLIPTISRKKFVLFDRFFTSVNPISAFQFVAKLALEKMYRTFRVN